MAPAPRSEAVLVVLLALGACQNSASLHETLAPVARVSDQIVASLEKRVDLRNLRLAVYTIECARCPQSEIEIGPYGVPRAVPHQHLDGVDTLLEHAFAIQLTPRLNVVDAELPQASPASGKQESDLRQWAERCGANAVLTGDYTTVGEQVYIAVRVIDVRNMLVLAAAGGTLETEALRELGRRAALATAPSRLVPVKRQAPTPLAAHALAGAELSQVAPASHDLVADGRNPEPDRMAPQEAQTEREAERLLAAAKARDDERERLAAKAREEERERDAAKAREEERERDAAKAREEERERLAAKARVDERERLAAKAREQESSKAAKGRGAERASGMSREQAVGAELEHEREAIRSAMQHVARGDDLGARFVLIKEREQLVRRAEELDSMHLARRARSLDDYLTNHVPGQQTISKAGSLSILRDLLADQQPNAGK